jgi:hypothetical protein
MYFLGEEEIEEVVETRQPRLKRLTRRGLEKPSSVG